MNEEEQFETIQNFLKFELQKQYDKYTVEEVQLMLAVIFNLIFIYFKLG